MQSIETVQGTTACEKVVNISEYENRKEGRTEKQQRRLKTADDKFSSLDRKEQRKILCFMIGYMEASKDLISSGNPGHGNEVSSIFQEMEELINESWNENFLRKKKILEDV